MEMEYIFEGADFSNSYMLIVERHKDIEIKPVGKGVGVEVDGEVVRLHVPKEGDIDPLELKALTRNTVKFGANPALVGRSKSGKLVAIKSMTNPQIAVVGAEHGKKRLVVHVGKYDPKAGAVLSQVSSSGTTGGGRPKGSKDGADVDRKVGGKKLGRPVGSKDGADVVRPSVGRPVGSKDGADVVRKAGAGKKIGRPRKS